MKYTHSIYYSPQNLEHFRQIISAQLAGDIILPYRVGLETEKYQVMLEAIDSFSLMRQDNNWHKQESTTHHERATLCEKLFSYKHSEFQELYTLLCNYHNNDDPSSLEMATIVANACLTNTHLWASLGLTNRAQLGQLIKHNFPALYASNTENMRWKRFFYRQLCQQGGDYICKAPSCGECKSYAECFA